MLAQSRIFYLMSRDELASNLDQIVRVDGGCPDDLLHIGKISGCRGSHAANGDCCLARQSSREDFVPSSECCLRLEVRID